MDPIRFGTDGWRARYGEGYTEDNVVRVTDAVARTFARKYPEGTIVVGYDTRRDGKRFAELAAGVLAGYGFDVKLSDSFCPTPAISWNVAHDPAAVGGVVLTASHGSGAYNGLKVRMEDGGASPKEFTDAVEAAVVPHPTDLRGAFETVDLMTPYLDNLASLVDADVIRGAGLTVVHDALFGASRTWAARLLGELGVNVVELHGEEDPDFGNLSPEPIEPWVAACERAVVESGASAGFANDGDADRIGAVDENGRFVSAHKLTALVLDALVERTGVKGRVVITSSGSVLVRRQAARLGCPLTVVPVGFKWIYKEMLKGDVILGGEESGGIGIPRYMPERDGLLVMLIVCELMARKGKTLGQLVESLEDKVGRMEYGRRDLSLDSTLLQMFQNVLPGLNPQQIAGMRPVEVSHTDGLRLGFADESWLLVRPSGTEPVVRVYAEAPSVEVRDALLDAGCALAQGEF